MHLLGIKFIKKPSIQHGEEQSWHINIKFKGSNQSWLYFNRASYNYVNFHMSKF